MTPRLAVRGVDVQLSGMPVVSGLSLEVDGGEIVALLGRNGAGKTTALRAIAGLERITAGRVLLDGDDVQNRPVHRVSRAGCALVLEGARIFRHLSVEANLRIGAHHAGRADVACRLEEQYRRFPSLAERRARSAGQLSGGEQALLAFAQGLMASPRVLLLDEPSVGLDVAAVTTILGVLTTLRDEGWAMLVAEQAVERILPVADRGYVLDVGRVVAHGTAGELRTSPALRSAYVGRGDRAR